MIAIIRKELADYVTSMRGLIILLMVFAISATALHAAEVGIQGVAAESEFIFIKLYTTSEQMLPQVMNFHTLIGLFFIPIVGIALGFDAVNSERSSGTLSRVLSQPVYRDEVINAKVLVRMLILTMMMATAMLVIGGIGLMLKGIPPSSEEISRILVYFIFTIIYGAFWLGLTVLFSVLFRSSGTSLLVSLALWLFFSLAPVVAAIVTSSATETTAGVLQTIARFSPSQLFLDASKSLLLPLVTTLGYIDPATAYYTTFMVFSPPALSQSLLLAAPNFVVLIGLTALVLAGSYVLFMKQEVRYG
jgi:ABC-2 type transport system permease protein